jgi:glyoxylase-like metal-dependent hydrolase (beta-lactamase superfamily II)
VQYDLFMVRELTKVLPWSQPLPAADPPEQMAMYRIETGTYTTRAAFAVTGGKFADKREFASNSVLISHPNGDLILDAGFGDGVADHIGMLARFERAPFTSRDTTARQLESAGYDLSNVIGVLLTHAHWDHVSGLDALDLPVLINDAEIDYGTADSHGAVFREVTKRHEIRKYSFTGGDYLGFPMSYDIHGDGSVVVALAAGHTPGSVVVFVTLPTGKRFAFIGDLTWQMDGITRGAERPWLMRRVADVDAATTRAGLKRSIALSGVMQVIPAHDVAAYADIPLLPATLTPGAS